MPPNKRARKFIFEKLTCLNVLQPLSRLKTKACGANNIDAQMFRLCSSLLTDYIIHIDKTCIDMTFFPSQWKSSFLKSIAKTSKVTELKILRRIICILPALSKILERCLEQELRDLVNRLNILPLYVSVWFWTSSQLR